MHEALKDTLFQSAKHLGADFDRAAGVLTTDAEAWEPPAAEAETEAEEGEAEEGEAEEGEASEADAADARPSQRIVATARIAHGLHGETIHPAIVVAVPLDPPLAVRFRLRRRYAAVATAKFLDTLFDETFTVATRKRSSTRKILRGDAEDLLFDAVERGWEPRVEETGVELWLDLEASSKDVAKAIDLATELGEVLLDEAWFLER